MKERIERAVAYLAARLSETSTWRGIILAGSVVFGYSVDEEHMLAYIAVGLLGAGVLAAAFPDKLPEDK